MQSYDVIIVGTGAGGGTLAAMANSLRVGDHPLDRMGGGLAAAQATA